MGTIRKAKPKNAAIRSVMGFVLALALGLIAWVVAPYVIQWMADNIANFTGRELEYNVMRALFSVVIFSLLLAFVWTIVAMAAPKKKMHISNKELAAERAAIEQEKRERKKRREKMRNSQ